MLTPFAGVLLNRDDAGLAKRLSFGGTIRTRISSQCLKRHWRTSADAKGLANLGAPLSVRSRQIVEYAIIPQLRERLPAVDPTFLEKAGQALSRALYGDKADEIKKRQALLLGWREIEYLTNVLGEIIASSSTAEEAVKGVEAALKKGEGKSRLSAIREAAGHLAAGIESALFGRMVTSDPAANTDAPLHVAHAFTVHEQESETDYFTVVDDLKTLDEDADSGSAGIFDTELTSGLFYSYVVIDVPLLVANLTGVAPDAWAEATTDRSLAGKLVEHLVHLMATVSPGAKKGATAPYAYATTLLAEAGDRQPRSLASAFESALRAGRGDGLAERAEQCMLNRLAAMDRVYGTAESRRLLSLHSQGWAGQPTASLADLGEWAAQCVVTGTA